ncbi:transcriptional regulator [Prosthecochloris marina]|uniref:Transcriptional regulator n=1 Tax=Prosthecochloris marina TaxID=2017681 RepID=A0A317T9U1_9CHLB|nr:transcriptional regulator [Prosthecochloris marina]PWW83170.1 transcriptional regulator [Prosthecochloris marina]
MNTQSKVQGSDLQNEEKDYNYKQLDKVIHSRIRFAALCYLDSVDQASFVEIRDGISATDGNLSVHMRKLEAAGYVYCDKTYSKRVPLSTYRITDTGRSAFTEYRSKLGDFFSLPFSTVHDKNL